jgi:adenylosuccinate lyase
MERNLMLPGNPRYQPKEMKKIFGYDNLYCCAIDVELATMEVLHELGFIPDEDFLLLTPELKIKIREEITTTIVDKVEREITKHDVRALVRLIQERLPESLRRFVHVPLTSYDVLDTARSLQFRDAYESALKPALMKVTCDFIQLTIEYSDQTQIGRTHGQHALPITVGFWLATILNRLIENWERLDTASKRLEGKISGAVGAYNAQVGLGLIPETGKTFEKRVLAKLGLKPARISTQILAPERLADYLFACNLLSATLGQFGRDCRHLMRSEIGELTESFEVGQVGSSTMAHKRNPINFENLEGMWLRTKNEFGKLQDILISEHQRDLVNSSVLRDLPIIPINLQNQLNTLLREKDGKSFLRRIKFDVVRIKENFEMSAKFIMAEPIYLALQLYGYQGDAHHLVNHTLMPEAKKHDISLMEALDNESVNGNEELYEILKKIPKEIRSLLRNPEAYTGQAYQKAMEVVRAAEDFIDNMRVEQT